MKGQGRAGGLAALLVALFPASLAAAPLFAPWNAGVDAEPAFQVQRLGADSYAIRQSIRTNFEAPFVFLFFGRDRALLLDSGAGGAALRPVIDALIADRGGPSALVVAHTHGHGDHIAGDADFAARPETTVVGHTPAAIAAFFSIKNWPRGLGRIDLGGHSLTVIPTPGHQPSHIMVHDARTQMLFSGDSLYPGRLTIPIDQFATFHASIDRVVAFTRRHPVTQILGAHIEMRTIPGEDYAPAARVHHGEHALELLPESLAELQAALHAIEGEPTRQTYKDFIIVPRWTY